MADGCLVCETLIGQRKTPGDVIYEDDFWQVDHALPPVFIPGLLIIKLKRHCEHLGELTPAEAAALGPLIPRVCAALQQVTAARKVHVASYGEGIQHVHFLVTPRTADLPASNIRLTFWLLWRRWLFQLGCKRVAYSEQAATHIAQQVHQNLA